MMKRGAAWGVGLVLLLAVVVLAGINMEGANAVTTSPVEFTTTTATVDSSDPVGTTPIRRLAVLGNPTCYVSGLTASQAGAVATFTVDAYGPDGTDAGTDLDWLGRCYSGAVTFSSSASNGLYYPSTSGIEASIVAGATFLDVRCTAISTAGTTVRWRRWVGLANTRGPATE